MADRQRYRTLPENIKCHKMELDQGWHFEILQGRQSNPIQERRSSQCPDEYRSQEEPLKKNTGPPDISGEPVFKFKQLKSKSNEKLRLHP